MSTQKKREEAKQIIDSNEDLKELHGKLSRNKSNLSDGIANLADAIEKRNSNHNH